MLILAVFALFAVLMVRRVVPALVAVPLMALLMALCAGVAPAQLGAIIVDGSASLAKVYVAVIFGALLGRVTLDTGIARAIVNVAAEYGGEQPLALALFLCAVVALLFTSLSGLGAIIMVASIVLPIMMTTGVPRTSAATLFLMAFALGFIFNIVNWKFYTQFFGVAPDALYRYAIVLAVIDAVALVLYALIAFRRQRNYATFAVAGAPPEQPRIAWYAMITPLVPLVLYYALHIDATPAFLIAAVYGALVTKPRNAIATLVAAAIRGVEDVAPAVLLFVGIGMLLAATKLPQFQAALAPLAGPWLRNPLVFVGVFGVLSPLSLYRGPLNPFGVGIAVFTALLTAHVLPPIILVAAVMAVVQVQNVCDPTNTANVWVANYTGVGIDEITRRTLPYQTAVAVLAVAIIALFPGAAGFASPWHAIASVARADELSGRGRIMVDANPDDARAVAATLATLRAAGYTAFAGHDDANARPCAGKTYAAHLDLSYQPFVLPSSKLPDGDTGLRLEDCGGWIVQEWHEHQPGATYAQLAQRVAQRAAEWLARNPERARHLLDDGNAYVHSDPATYYFTLFKTYDGNMRAYVRAGGPAYDAGLRSGDIVMKVDGRFWWEYGTFQTQLRAYDGKPHSLEVQRGTATVEVQLGSAFVPGGE